MYKAALLCAHQPANNKEKSALKVITEHIVSPSKFEWYTHMGGQIMWPVLVMATICFAVSRTSTFGTLAISYGKIVERIPGGL